MLHIKPGMTQERKKKKVTVIETTHKSLKAGVFFTTVIPYHQTTVILAMLTPYRNMLLCLRNNFSTSGNMQIYG